MNRGVRIITELSRRELVTETLHAIAGNPCRCPAHSAGLLNSSISPLHRQASSQSITTDYAYETFSPSVRIGKGATREVGMDFVNRGVKRVLLFTDKNLIKLLPFKATEEALRAENVEFDVFSEVRIEPTEKSFKEAIHRAQMGQYEGFLAVGGGSVMDTAKVARLFDTYPEKDFFDFVNQPVGKGEPIYKQLKPLICIPTTSGTGSETTGVAICQMESLKAKTGFSNRALCPSLAIVDSLNTLSMPKNVAIYTGFDVLCHALESYTNIPYNKRSPLPLKPLHRPQHQGANPISDIWAVETLKIINNNFVSSIESLFDEEASSQMSFASLLAGIGFSSSGVHLCHALSFALSGSVKEYCPSDYSSDHPIIPHGLSVVMTAPAVFNEVAYVAPDRCIQLAGLLGANTNNVKTEDVGRCLSDQLCKLMKRLEIPNGLTALGFSPEDIPMLVKKTLPQERITRLYPNRVTSSLLERILLNSMTVYNK